MSPESAAKAAANSVRFERDTIPDYLRQNPTKSLPGLGWWPPDLRLRRSDLCTSCRAIDFEAAFTTPRISYGPEKQWPYIYERRDRSANEVERDSNCQFCRYLANAVDPVSETGDYTLEFHNGTETYHDHDSVLIKVSPFARHSQGTVPAAQMRSVSNTIICHRNKPIRKAGRPQIVSPGYDALLAQLWLKMCRDIHPQCGVEDDPQIPKTRLINCLNRTLVPTGSKTDPRPSFVALSYVWGGPPSEPKEPQNQVDHLPRKLPLTIEDAITVTKDLGFQYLWVDQYCIDQEDQADKARQISQMNLIYKSADLTIIAAGGDSCQSGLPGVSDWRRDILDPFVLDDVFTFGIRPREEFYHPSFENGSWHTRGWTFQEGLLSRRLLVFTDTAMHYECKGHESEAWQSEMSGGVECEHYDVSRAYTDYDRFPSVVGPNSVLIESEGKLDRETFGDIQHRGFVSSLWTYMRLATRYTTRSLSYESDGLNAFRGVANELQNFNYPVFNLSGIPFVASKSTRVTEMLALNSFLRGLEWQSGSDGEAHNLEFPSWSWANDTVWDVSWSWDNEHAAYLYDKILSKAICSAHDMQVEFDCPSGNKELQDFVAFAKECGKSTHLDQLRGNPTALCFKTRILNSSFATRDHICDRKTIIEFGKVYSDLGYGELEIRVHDVVSTQQQSNESGRADQVHASQTICSREADDERLYTAMASGKYGLVLLRFNDWDASVLLVEWVSGKQDGHQRTARRVGICLFDHSGAKEGDSSNPFLRCFSSDVDIRLV